MLLKFITRMEAKITSQKMSAYVDYRVNLVRNSNPAGRNSDNIVSSALVYQFS
ncbi:porin [Klebsiella aerogenes]|nr:porin [Klebsiella aerogenes]